MLKPKQLEIDADREYDALEHELFFAEAGSYLSYIGGVTGWLYYQMVSTTYGLLGLVAAPPLVHEINRAGEAMMVLASRVSGIVAGSMRSPCAAHSAAMACQCSSRDAPGLRNMWTPAIPLLTGS